VRELDYPNYETIVVNDGSTDGVARIAERFPVRLITTPNRGLSAARNTGLANATGEIVAYLDDDARPDPQWLRYLSATFAATDHVGVGGPNIAPPEDNFRATCVAHAPGGPIHVLLTDTLAEHLPGCNMAFRKASLQAIGGFDERFRIAGDDVDVCWRLQARGWTLGFSPAAMVWHHRRAKLRAYWKQQLNYGRAEAMLERKWPEKYNALGNPTWNGRLYGAGVLSALGWNRRRIYHGTWGAALFQSVYHSAPGTLYALPTTPEWYLILLLLTAISAWGLIWPPMLLAAPVLVLAAGITAAQAFAASISAYPRGRQVNRLRLWKLRLVTAWLHLIQPAARLTGRLRTGLTPWRLRGPRGLALPLPRKRQLWTTDTWRSLEQRLEQVESELRAADAVVVRGGDFDDWDLEVRGGMIGSIRLRMTVEEHGDNRQMFRLRAWPRCSRGAAGITLLFILICDVASFAAAWETWAVSGALVLLLLGWMFREIGAALSAVLHVTRRWQRAGRL
jgi:GT2 family glycosyltransferase